MILVVDDDDDELTKLLLLLGTHIGVPNAISFFWTWYLLPGHILLIRNISECLKNPCVPALFQSEFSCPEVFLEKLGSLKHCSEWNWRVIVCTAVHQLHQWFWISFNKRHSWSGIICYRLIWYCPNGWGNLGRVSESWLFQPSWEWPPKTKNSFFFSQDETLSFEVSQFAHQPSEPNINRLDTLWFARHPQQTLVGCGYH